MERLTKKAVGCFKYALKDHKAVPGEFGTYEAFFDYSMAVKRLGEFEELGLDPDQIRPLLPLSLSPGELAPCPFCGKRTAVVDTIANHELTERYDPNFPHKSSVYGVVCNALDGGCGAACGGEYDTPEEAIAAWNKRTNPI